MITTTIKSLENSEIEITGEIPTDLFESFRDKTIKKIRTGIEIPGFRKGHAPDNLIIEKVGDEKILYEMAEEALAHYYPEILKENKIDAISRPEITITKIAKDNPLGFTIKTAVMPKFKLADYQKIAKTEVSKKPEEIIITDKEIDDTIEEIRKSRAKHTHTAESDHSKEETTETKSDLNKTEPELPEINDDFAKTLGQFDSLIDLKNKIKENLATEKKQRATEKKRLEIMENIISKTKIELPKILVEGELNKLAQEMRYQLESMGLKYDDYLAHLKKTEEDLRKEWEPEAIKRSKFGLILKAIATAEKITTDETELEKETAHILKQYPDADPIQVKTYTGNMIINEKVFKFLENLE